MRMFGRLASRRTCDVRTVHGLTQCRFGSAEAFRKVETNARVLRSTSYDEDAAGREWRSCELQREIRPESVGNPASSRLFGSSYLMPGTHIKTAVSGNLWDPVEIDIGDAEQRGAARVLAIGYSTGTTRSPGGLVLGKVAAVSLAAIGR
jgi:hypothetical protein